MVPSQTSILATSHQTKSWIVIPARMASTRLPNKLALRETGKPLIQHTYEAALRADLPSGMSVAVDGPELAKLVEAFQGEAIVTDPQLPSGTDRVAVVAHQKDDVDIFVNVQGDEPEIAGEAIDCVIRILAENPEASMATLACPIRDRRLLDDPSCVKVVRNAQGEAVYFSRSAIPHARSWDDNLLLSDPPVFLQHMGIYAYRREFLLNLSRFPESRLERLERLEQLRFLDAGCRIQLGISEHQAKGIDTPADYRAFVQRHTWGNRQAA